MTEKDEHPGMLGQIDGESEALKVHDRQLEQKEAKKLGN
jgi:hypothetical protein